MGSEGEGCHTVRDEMFRCIQWNNNPGPMSCIWDFQHHERGPTLEMKGCHGLASKFKVKSPLSHVTLKCLSTLPLPFDVWSGQVPSFFQIHFVFFPILRKDELFNCWCHAVCTLLCFLDFYNILCTISWWKYVCDPCSDNKAKVSVSGHLPKTTELPSWQVHWCLSLPKFEWPGMISSRNFNSVGAAKAPKQCSLDPPYTCIYLGLKKRMEKNNRKRKNSSFPEIFLDNIGVQHRPSQPFRFIS